MPFAHPVIQAHRRASVRAAIYIAEETAENEGPDRKLRQNPVKAVVSKQKALDSPEPPYSLTSYPPKRRPAESPHVAVKQPRKGA